MKIIRGCLKSKALKVIKYALIMSETKTYGRLERIIEKIYQEGGLYCTIFEIQTEGRTEEYDFYGEIPEEFIGKDIMYHLTEEESQQNFRTEQTISVGN